MYLRALMISLLTVASLQQTGKERGTLWKKMEESFYSSSTPVLRDKLLKELKKNGLVIKVLDW